MTLLFDRTWPIDGPTLAPSAPAEARRGARPRTLRIALVNNMPDAALKATERQFARLLTRAAAGRPLALHAVSLQDVPRSAAARAHLSRHAIGLDALMALPIDGVIVTGAEPRAPSLREEPYWDALRRVVDWAEANTRSAIFSCLAAHAAALHLDGVERRPLEQKCSGLFRCNSRATHWLGRDLGASVSVAHSRLNELRSTDLVDAGYHIVTHSPAVGVDMFTKRLGSAFVFFQGHPEYDADSLQREYLRDIGRYVSGERGRYPELPAGYFSPETEAALEAVRARIERRRDPAILSALPALALRDGVAAETDHAAAAVFRNWLDFLWDEDRA